MEQDSSYWPQELGAGHKTVAVAGDEAVVTAIEADTKAAAEPDSEAAGRKVVAERH